MGIVEAHRPAFASCCFPFALRKFANVETVKSCLVSFLCSFTELAKGCGMKKERFSPPSLGGFLHSPVGDTAIVRWAVGLL